MLCFGRSCADNEGRTAYGRGKRVIAFELENVNAGASLNTLHRYCELIRNR